MMSIGAVRFVLGKVGMNGLLCGLGLGLFGCGGMAERTLTLVAPVAEPCDAVQNPGCQPVYDSCESLGVKRLTISVGVLHGTENTIACPSDLSNGESIVPIHFVPGENVYMLDARIEKQQETTYITAGPFVEQDALWRLALK